MISKQGAWILTGIFGTPVVLGGFILPTMLRLNPAVATILIVVMVINTVVVCHAWSNVE